MGKITIIPTRDAALIQDIVTHPDILNGGVDGGCFVYHDDPQDNYALVVYNGILCGLGRFTEVRRGSYEIHAMLYKEWRGAFALEAGRVFQQWLFTNYPVFSLFTYVSDEYRFGAVYCRAMGLKRVGVIHDFFEHNGRRYDATMYSATRQDLGYEYQTVALNKFRLRGVQHGRQ